MKRLTGKEILIDTTKIQDESTKDWADNLIRFLKVSLKKIASIPFNRSEELTVADTGNVDTTVTLVHHLERVPEGLIVTRISKAGILYVDSTDLADWSTTEIKFKCSVANAALKFYLF